ncbi:MAG: 4Fe-4S dicluster domain-containing protein, partial [Candidatus Methylomirabilota bacterium]
DPRVVEARCTGCGECGEVCAAKAIRLMPGGRGGGARVEIDRERCIACFCCQEMCPQGAIEVSAGLAARLLRLGTGRSRGGSAR